MTSLPKTLLLCILAFGQYSQLVTSAASPRAAFVTTTFNEKTRTRQVDAASPVGPLSLSSETTSSATSLQLEEPNRVVQRVFATDKRPVILFDGVCNMCNGAVNLALDWDPQGKLRFAALQSKVGQALLQSNGRASDDISSIVLVNESGAYVKSDAILRITEALTPLRLLPLKPAAVLGRYVVPKFLRDLIYDGVANNRYSIMGKQDQCRFDADGEFEDRFVKDDLALKKT